jgi:excisionase family DNA binding protein
MAHTRLNPRRAKLHRSYTVEETARLFGVHRNTVRAWLKNGLPSTDSNRPLLIKGEALRTFLEARRAAAKRPCPPGTLYCLKCREPRPPALGMVDFLARRARAGNLRALCATCGTAMHRRARCSAIGTIMPGLEVLIVEAPPRITECQSPSPNCA